VLCRVLGGVVCVGSVEGKRGDLVALRRVRLIRLAGIRDLEVLESEIEAELAELENAESG